tara:strand:- start:3915 stop:5345 length:1431 start_codon:yes stop_codon:yes gene_type:complete
MNLEVFINHIPGETRLVVAQDGRLIDLVIARDHENTILGNIYLGRIEKVVAGLNAAFVDIGQNVSGFLAAADGQIFDRNAEKPKPISAIFNEGDKVLVQVTREASPGKGAKLTTRLSLTGRTIVLTPGRTGVSVSKSITDENEQQRLREALAGYAQSEAGLIVRTRAQGVADEFLKSEAEALTDIWLDIEATHQTMKPPACVHQESNAVAKYLRDRGDPAWQRIVVDDRTALARFTDSCADAVPELVPLFELAEDPVALLETHDLDQQIDDLLQPHVSLPSGGQLIIEETAALVAIDVDSGTHTRDRDPEAFALAVNKEAAHEIARQVVLRNLSGQIVIDMLPLKRRENRDKIQNTLAEALAGDAANCNIFGFSRLGNLEMTRRRMGESLTRRFLVKSAAARSPESAALDAFRAILRELERNPGKSLTVQCGAELHALLTGEMQRIWQSLLERTGPVVVLEKSPELLVAQFDIRIN